MIRYLVGFVIAALLGGGAYLKGRTDGAAGIKAKWQEDRAVMAEAFADASARSRELENERARAAQEVADGLASKLVAADASVAGLSRRLRRATAPRAGDCPVPVDPAPAGTDSGTSGIPDGTVEIERLADAAWSAAARDSARLTACQAAYGAVRQADQPGG